MSKANTELLDGLEYVSRGGLKLEKALDYFNISPEGKVCLDSGASTGGFTDCLLKRGARHVYAIDVGYGQLAWSLRNDERVFTMERTNIRYVTPDMLDLKPELVVLDLSFISLGLVLPVIRELMADKSEAAGPDINPEVICLIKPQFEAGKGKVGKKGVVRDKETHKEVLDKFIQNAEKANLVTRGLTYSPVKGPKGNIEYLAWLSGYGDNIQIDTGEIVSESHAELA